MLRSGMTALVMVGLVAVGTPALAGTTRTETHAYVDVGGDFGGQDDCEDSTLPGIGRVCFLLDKRDRFVRVQVADATTLQPCAVLNFRAADGRVLPPHNFSFVGHCPKLAVPAGTATVTINVLQLTSAVWCGAPTGPGTVGTIMAKFATRR